MDQEERSLPPLCQSRIGGKNASAAEAPSLLGVSNDHFSMSALANSDFRTYRVHTPPVKNHLPEPEGYYSTSERAHGP
ncbi:hypothetical protein JTE90_002299 [Oedothorax gibbosus]|uniref:Uncharacterized protein n=1 Tax=Oedothorax gibbosus TaxID=931172 RepID=A0AAV6UJZ3_9ARAC|nr:hypothetical protein JTE90_002299 [Oedothorax gibbosus]